MSGEDDYSFFILIAIGGIGAVALVFCIYARHRGSRLNSTFISA